MILNTKRLILRPFTIEDAVDVYEYASLPDTGIHAGWQPHSSIEETCKIISNIFLKEHTFAIVDKATDKVMGSVSLMSNERRVGNYLELGYTLGKAYWYNGYMTEAVDAVLKYAFGNLQLDYVIVSHDQDNVRSKNVIVKSGFQYEGILHQDRARFDGKIINSCWYYLTKQKYYQLHPQK